MTAIALPVTKNVEQNSTNDLISTNIAGVYTGVAASQPLHGTTAVVGGTHLYYTPTPGYLGPDSFTYTASWPPRGQSAPSTVTINVVSSRSTPLLSDSYQTVNCNSSNNVVPLDFVNIVSSFNIVVPPKNGIATILGQEIVYTPNFNFEGSDVFEYTASNANGTSNTATVYITVNPLLAVAAASSQTVVFNSVNNPIKLNVVGVYDAIHVTSTSTHGSLHIGTTSINYTPNNQYSGSDSFNYYVSNVMGVSDIVTVSLTVKIPVITALPATGELPKAVKHVAYTPIALTASGGLAPYTTSIISGSLPPGMTLNGNIISGTPTIDVGSIYQFTVAFTDSHSPTHFTVYNDYILAVYDTASSAQFQWFTPSGLLFTATSGVSTSTVLEASNYTATYALIAGTLPNGLELQSTGLITGTPADVTNLEHYKFVVRASTPTAPPAITDNTFTIDVSPQLSSLPVWSYNSNPYRLTGPIANNFVNQEYVNIPLIATSPTNSPITYSLISNYGSLPNNLSVSADGVLSGFLMTDTVPGINDSYSFDVAASSNNFVSTQTFTMTVETIVLDIVENIYRNSIDVTPQFINSSFLGYFSDRENQYIPVTAYDPYPVLGPITYTTGPNTILPSGLHLDRSTGFLYGYVNTQTDYLVTYPITVRATKTNPRTTHQTIAVNTFTLTIVHKGFDVIDWITTSSLGSVVVGVPSMLKIEGTQTSNIFPLQYGINTGSLPPGLTLNPDGNIIGIATTSGVYTATIIASPAPYGIGSINPTATDFPFEFNLRTFTLTASATDVPYTNIYLKPLLTGEKRAVYNNFISNSSIFAPELLYRPDDINFGTEPELKMYLEYGIQELNSSTDYVSALDNNFYNRTLYFGNVDTLTALDSSGNPVYDLVYVEIVDPLKNVNAQVTSNETTYYPGSIQNMRTNLEAVADVNPSMAPLFVQTAKNAGLGQLNIIVLCYALAGKGNKIVTRIKNSGFDFSQFDFTVDRITIENTLASTGSSYIIFPHASI